VCLLLRSTDGLSSISQVVGAALGIFQQPSADEVADRGVNLVKVVKQQTRYIVGVDLTFCVRLVDYLGLDLGERHHNERI